MEVASSPSGVRIAIERPAAILPSFQLPEMGAIWLLIISIRYTFVHPTLNMRLRYENAFTI